MKMRIAWKVFVALSVYTVLILYLQLENLEYILLRLNSVPDVWQIPVFPKAWQNILVTPLTKGKVNSNLHTGLAKHPSYTIH